MSADAKVWKEGYFWKGIHDGPCHKDSFIHEQGDISLAEVLLDIHKCMDRSLSWEIKEHNDGLGLSGYGYTRSD